MCKTNLRKKPEILARNDVTDLISERIIRDICHKPNTQLPSINVLNALNLLLLSQQGGHLSPQLLESFDWNRHANALPLDSEDLHVDFGPEHLGQVVRAQHHVDLPLAAGIVLHCAGWLLPLLQALNFVLVALQQTNVRVVLGVHEENLGFERGDHSLVDLRHILQLLDVVLGVGAEEGVNR